MAHTTLEAGSATMFRPGTSDTEIEASALKAMRQRKTLVRFWQIAILVFVIGMWELSSDMQWIDPFFYSQPERRSCSASTNGQPKAPRKARSGINLWVTMEEALIGFFAGSITGVVVGIGLGRNRFLSDIFSVYIKAINSIPRVVLGPDLHHDHGSRPALQGCARLHHGILRGIRQCLPRRARGRP